MLPRSEDGENNRPFRLWALVVALEQVCPFFSFGAFRGSNFQPSYKVRAQQAASHNPAQRNIYR